MLAAGQLALRRFKGAPAAARLTSSRLQGVSGSCGGSGHAVPAFARLFSGVNRLLTGQPSPAERSLGGF